MDLQDFNFAFQSLKNEKRRTFLTLLGIVIGIAMIVMFIVLGNSVQNYVTKEFESLGSNTITVQPGSSMGMATAYSRLHDHDLKDIESISGVADAMAYYESSAVVRKGKETVSAMIIGVDPKKNELLKKLRYADLREGRLLKESDKYSIILFEDFADKAFKQKVRVGQSLEIKGKKFKITGIVKNSYSMISGLGIFISLMPEDTVKELLHENNPNEIMVWANKKEEINQVTERIENKLEKTHGQKDFSVMTSESLIKQITQVLGLIQLFFAGIASIALLVGAIGIMNSMVMNVIERMNEIGVMKAVGATTNKVLGLFLLEAGFVGGLGGLIGGILGTIMAIGVGIGASYFNFNLPVNVDFVIILEATLFAFIIGIIAGIIPAQMAAKLDPVEVLRYE